MENERTQEPARSDVAEAARGKDFIRQIVTEEVAAGKNGGRVQTRFPPEPNGYLHIGHAMAICVNFGVAEEFGGKCYLRFDDTNPERETEEFVEGIKNDVRWLGFDWQDRLRHASDYFPKIYECARELIENGLAYVDHSTAEEIRANRGTLTEPGKKSRYRDRSVAENLDLLERMKRGEFEEGECVLRAKIDMASPNINLRDPTLYRIRKVAHQRTGDAWCIYPMYDYAHTLSDAIEGTTHSLCSLEFEDHRPLYDWFLDRLWKAPSRPRQIEFSRLNLMFTVMSKRILKRLVDEKHVDGWDDPRMPTLSGIRRRGYTPESIREFVTRVGVTKKEKVAELGLFEGCIREHLNEVAPRRFAVLDPLKLVLENYPDTDEWLEAANHPAKPELGVRKVPFSREVLIEREDFMENAPGKFHRLKPGGEVRLRYGYIVKCERVVKSSTGEITELRCTYDPATRSGSEEAGRKVKGTIHWVSAKHAFFAPVRLYDRLFITPFPGGDLTKELNPDSLEVVERAALEPALAEAKPGERFQFERSGYFVADTGLSKPGKPVFNRTVTLRDSWAKLEQEALAKLPQGRPDR